MRFGEDARQTMLIGVRKLVKAVATTLGPKVRRFSRLVLPYLELISVRVEML